MLRNLSKIVKLNSINNIQKTVRWKIQNPVPSAAVHTTRSEHQCEIIDLFVKFVLNTLKFFSAVFHGDFEWQDPKSEDEV